MNVTVIEPFLCNFCRRSGDTFSTISFERLVLHYQQSHGMSVGRVYAMFGKVKP